jgi:hypothetical protein
LYRPASILWDGASTWVLLDGHPDDVDDEARAAELIPVDGPPPLPRYRWSVRPRELASLPGDGHGPFVAQVGVGIVHRDTPQPPRSVDPSLRTLHERLKVAFDPTGRFAPGRRWLP